jgi:hypothetical protein
VSTNRMSAGAFSGSVVFYASSVAVGSLSLAGSN